VSCLWVQTIGAGDADYDQPVLPDGCIDIVSVNGEVRVAGPATRAVTERFAPGSTIAGVRFRTGAAPPLLGVSAAELRDQDVGMDDLWGHAGAALAARSADALGAPGSSRLEPLIENLDRRLEGAPALDPVATGIAQMLARAPARPLRELADEVALSERQLRRRVEVAVGYSPRTLGRILRFQRFLGAARTAPPSRRDLARLAVETGYADQAHLTRESRQLAGLPPASLLDWEAHRLASTPEPAVARRGYRRSPRTHHPDCDLRAVGGGR
jgi:AraC-like DNA-binding protein